MYLPLVLLIDTFVVGAASINIRAVNTVCIVETKQTNRRNLIHASLCNSVNKLVINITRRNHKRRETLRYNTE